MADHVGGQFTYRLTGNAARGYEIQALRREVYDSDDYLEGLKAFQEKRTGNASIFAFGLVAFGFLCMGPVNIAVDSYGPVTDNAQSIFELAQTEHIPGIKEEIKRDFGFEPDFHTGKHYLDMFTFFASSALGMNHPSLADDNCSGIALLTQLAKRLSQRKTRYSYRFLFAPGTIGAITWLSRNQENAKRIRAGLTLTCLGDAQPFTYKRTVFGDAEVDRVLAAAFKSLSGSLDMLPDVLERECGLSVDAVQQCITAVDRARQALYDQLLELCDALGAEDIA